MESAADGDSGRGEAGEEGGGGDDRDEPGCICGLTGRLCCYRPFNCCVAIPPIDSNCREQCLDGDSTYPTTNRGQRTSSTDG